jgi:hypothetical protein
LEASALDPKEELKEKRKLFILIDIEKPKVTVISGNFKQKTDLNCSQTCV